MTDERRVDMVRLANEERYYDREALLGRDTASVFPTLSRQQQAEAEAEGLGGLSADTIKEALGARKFISESELETLRATRGVTADDGAVAIDKPLAEILMERKAAKDAEHAEKWRLMKVGKNRPLDPEELLFLDSVAAAEAERERAWGDMERAELEAFKAAVRERSAEPEVGPGAEAEGRQRPVGPVFKADPRVPSIAAASASASLLPKPVIKPLVKIKPKTAPAPPPTSASSSAAATASGVGAAAAREARAPPSTSTLVSCPGKGVNAGVKAAEEPPSKRAKLQEGIAGGEGQGTEGGAESEDGGGGGGLAGLIGNYGSDSEADGE